MKKIISAFLIIYGVMASPSASQDSNSFDMPEYSENAKFLIIHADDMGLSHSTNAAVRQAFEQKAINSGSVMVPCPWFPEIAEYARKHSGRDIGIHLTLTSEWEYFKWGSVLPGNEVPSLLDENGFFYSTVDEFLEHAEPGEVEREIRAQIERAIGFGMKPTHVDSHMGSLFTSPELFRIYQKVAREHNLPSAIPFDMVESMAPHLKEEILPESMTVNTFVSMNPEIAGGNWTEAYEKILSDLQPGLNVLILHLSYDNDEMRAVAAGEEAYGSEWRQNDLDYIMSNEFQEHLDEHDIIPMTWKEAYENFLVNDTEQSR